MNGKCTRYGQPGSSTTYWYICPIQKLDSEKFFFPTEGEGRKIFFPQIHFLPMEDTMSQLNYIAEQVSYFGYDVNNFPEEIFPDDTWDDEPEYPSELDKNFFN